MSEWPKRYEPSLNRDGFYHAMFESSSGQFVEFEHFERLLTFTINFISPYNPGPLPLEVLRENILLQLKKEAENG